MTEFGRVRNFSSPPPCILTVQSCSRLVSVPNGVSCPLVPPAWSQSQAGSWQRDKIWRQVLDSASTWVPLQLGEEHGPGEERLRVSSIRPQNWTPALNSDETILKRGAKKLDRGTELCFPLQFEQGRVQQWPHAELGALPYGGALFPLHRDGEVVLVPFTSLERQRFLFH